MDEADYRNRMEIRNREMKHLEDLLAKGGCCVICGYNSDPRILEQHHIAGKKNRDITIPVCPNCHRSLSIGQEPLKIERGRDSKTDLEKLGWHLDGYFLLLRLLSIDLLEQSKKIFGGEYDG